MFMTLILFIVILGLLVFVHEFGHFISAKKLGAKAEEFGFGFPPRLIGTYKNSEGKYKIIYKKTPSNISGTIYSLNWIPLGGFVRIKGEDGSGKRDPESFASKPVWKRAVILVAGVTMNVVLAMALLAAGLGLGMPQVIEGSLPGATIKDRSLQVVSVKKDSPADAAGFKTGDEILSLDGRQFDFGGIQNYLSGKIGAKVEYSIKREGNVFSKSAVPEILPETGKGGIGVGLVEVGLVSYPWHLAIWRGVADAFLFLKEILVVFGGLIRDLLMGRGVSVDLSGPVGIAVLTGKVARLGLVYILQFTALLSLNLAVVNALPFPALDGGRLLFLAFEKLRGRPISQKVESAVHNIGFLLLMVLVVMVSYRDIMKFSDKFSNLWQNIIR